MSRGTPGRRPVPDGVAAVVADMQSRLDALPAKSGLRDFLSTYQRTTSAVGKAILDGVFEDGDWVEEWDVVFARLYLDAFDAQVAGTGDVPRPWRIAFDVPADLAPLRKVLLGINAHVNYDLPQALLRVIPDDDFADPGTLARRKRDHEAIDGVLASRVAAEDEELTLSGAKSVLDRLLQPLNRASSKRFLREARQKVWHNTHELQSARLESPDAYGVRLGELEVLSAARVADLLAPGQVLLRLAVAGFGVVLPPPA
jgi:Family of unknown function (DUF5995)